MLPSDTTGMRQTDYWNGYKFRPDDVVIAWRV